MARSTLVSLLLTIVACSLLEAFLIPAHREVTQNALASFSRITDAERTAMIRGCIDADLVEGNLPVTGGPYDGRFHFDNQFSFAAILSNYVVLSRLIDRNLAKNPRDPWEFGKAMHAIEDFYSHSNYVSTYRDYLAQTGNELVGSIPTFEEALLDPKTYRSFIDMLAAGLRTGRYPLPNWYSIPGDTDHGHLFGPGLNKDSLHRPLFADARETATRAVSWYLKLYTKDRDAARRWTAFKKICLAPPTGRRP